jgi:hypothetical protein
MAYGYFTYKFKFIGAIALTHSLTHTAQNHESYLHFDYSRQYHR